MASTKGFSPDWTTHPGEHLAEYLEAREISQAAFARQAGMTPKHVSEIINGKAPVMAETALKLEAALGLKAEIWMGLQVTHDLFHARKRNRGSAEAHA